MNIEKVISLIEDRKETDVVDFKLQFYAKECKSDMIKDIVSFANSRSEEDKYIIFGFDNINYILNDVDYDKIEDVSNYVELLSDNVEPFIDFTIERFRYKDTDMACVYISKTNKDRPYMIKKDFSRKGVILLKHGEIYIRKQANNFIASRADLDAIYDAKRQIKIYPGNGFFKVILKNGIEKKCFWGLKFNMVNNTNMNLAINDGKLTIKTTTNTIEVKILYIENYSENYNFFIKKISDTPFYISNSTQLSKVLIFELSEKLEQIIKHSLRQNSIPGIEILLTDIDGNIYMESTELKFI